MRLVRRKRKCDFSLILVGGVLRASRPAEYYNKSGGIIMSLPKFPEVDKNCNIDNAI